MISFWTFPDSIFIFILVIWGHTANAFAQIVDPDLFQQYELAQIFGSI
jgi:hypothetical protein